MAVNKPALKNKVRIIGGEWRSRRIAFPDHPDLRPTPDRVRETLFNWLGQDLTGKTCLDLFAGSGALGFEAASRGAKRVVMVERDANVARALQENAALLDKAGVIEIRRAEALEFLRGDRNVYDVVFLDPPFNAGLEFLAQVIDALPAHLSKDALVHVESPEKLETPALLSREWQVVREGRAGAVVHQLLKRG